MTLKTFMAGVLLAASGCLVVVPVAHSDPLIPPSPGELQYLDQARRLLPGSGDPVAVNSDGELLDLGRYSCFRRDSTGLIGYEATYVSPILTQLAFIYLCPQ